MGEPEIQGSAPERHRTRAAVRLRRRLLVTLLRDHGYTVNVGSGGFCAEAARLPDPGDSVDGTISAAGRVFLFAGRVAWVRPGALALGMRGTVGVEFTRIAPEFRDLLSFPPRA